MGYYFLFFALCLLFVGNIWMGTFSPVWFTVIFFICAVFTLLYEAMRKDDE